MTDSGYTTLGRHLFWKDVPEDLRKPEQTMDKKAIAEFYKGLAEKYPEQYKDILQKHLKISEEAGTYEGGSASLGLDDLRLPPAMRAKRDLMRTEVEGIRSNPRLSGEEKNAKIIDTMKQHLDSVPKQVIEEGLGRGNAFSVQHKAGIKGSPAQINQILFGDMLVTDQRDKPIPIAGLRSYSEGLSPAEHWAAAYGSRKGYCLAAGTQVRMVDGTTKSIQDIEVSDVVLGADKEGRTFPVKVLRTFDQGLKECRRFEFRVGRSARKVDVVATEDHNVLSLFKNGSAQGEDFQVLPLRMAKHAFGVKLADGYCQGVENEPLAYVVGQLIGDGHFGEMSLTLTSADMQAVESVRGQLRSIGFDLTEIPRNRASGMPSYEYRVVDPERARFGRSRARDYFSKYMEVGVLSYNKRVGDAVYALSEASLFDLVEGYFESDGSVGKGSAVSTVPAIRFHSTSLGLLEDVKEILETRLGVQTSGIATSTRRSHSSVYGYSIDGQRDSHTLKVTHRDAVGKLIVRFQGRGRKAVAAQKMLSDMQEAKRDERLVATFQKRSEVEVLPTYDIEVDHPDHLFVLANGMIVSNSAVQFATAQIGYLGKQVTQTEHKINVEQNDCGSSDGLEAEPDDADNLGRVLAKDAGGLKAGTVIDKSAMATIKAQGRPVYLRSPLTCLVPTGVCQICTGKMAGGKFPPIGEPVGVSTSRVMTEPLVQGIGMGTKHSGGVASTSVDINKGFDAVNQMFQIPKNFKNKATLAERDGRIDSIEDAPQGGKYITSGDSKQYVAPDREISVKAGDAVEAGDILTDGTPHPAEILQHKGIGAGRKYFVSKLGEILKANSADTNKRNIELFAKSYMNRVRITDEEGFGGHDYDSLVDYGQLQQTYKPRLGSESVSPSRAVGRYLEHPVLHYTIGTRISKSVKSDLDKAGVGKIVVHQDAPGFEPYISRTQDVAVEDPDWKVRQSGFGIKRALIDSAQQGSSSSNINNPSYLPKLMDPTRL